MSRARGGWTCVWIAGGLLVAGCRGGDRSDGPPDAAPAATPSAPIAVGWTPDGALEVTGLTADQIRALERSAPDPDLWRTILPVRTREADSLAAPPMLGAYAIVDGRVRFTPRFPLAAGVGYVAVFSPARSGHERLASAFGELEVRRTFQVPRSGTPATTTVEAVYPSTGDVPMNLLKLYIHFSSPMRLGDAYDHVRLVDDSGTVVEDAFLVVSEELWDPERRRFTLFFDPGRIKRDLRPNERLGLPLVEGREYRIVVDPAWRDGSGRPLAAGFEKPLRVGPPDRASPDPAAWGVVAPGAGTSEALVIELDEPLDRALLERMLTVVDLAGNPVRGRVEVGGDERGWWFVPDSPWAPGRYAVRVDPRIEDLAGNTIGRLFDEKAGSTTTRTPTRPTDPPTDDEIVLLPFDVGAGTPP